VGDAIEVKENAEAKMLGTPALDDYYIFFSQSVYSINLNPVKLGETFLNNFLVKVRR
jgi:hypothetical protein